MFIYFQDHFDEGIQDFSRKNDPHIISARMQHTEGAAAYLCVNMNTQNTLKNWVVLHDGEQVEFIGKIIGKPTLKNDKTYDVYFIGVGEHFDEMLSDFLNGVRETHPISPLISNDDHPVNPLEILDTLPVIHRTSHTIAFPKQTETICLDAGVIENSIKIDFLSEPVECVETTCCVSWIQKQGGFFDLYPYIARQFPRGVETYRPESLKRFFPMSGQRLSHKPWEKSGYNVVRSRLERDPKKGLGRSPKYTANNGEVQFQKTYLDGEMIVGWSSEVPRQQSLAFSTGNMENPKRIKKLKFHLQLPPCDRPSVMDDADVQNALSDIQKIAHAYHKRGQNVQRLRCTVHNAPPLLHPGQCVQIDDFVGVISDITNDIHFDKNVTHITVLNHIFDDVCGNDFDDFEFQDPDDTYTNMQSWEIEKFIDSIDIFNTPQWQERAWKALEHDEKNIADFKALLKEHPTMISIQLNPLNPKDILIQAFSKRSL